MIKTFAEAGQANEPAWQGFRRGVQDYHGSTEAPEAAWRNEVDRRLDRGSHRTDLIEQRQQLIEAKHAEELLGIHEKLATNEIQMRDVATKEDIRGLVRLQWAMAGLVLLALLVVVFYAAVRP